MIISFNLVGGKFELIILLMYLLVLVFCGYLLLY